MFLYASIFGGSILIFILIVWVLAREQDQGDRLFLSGARTALDRGLCRIAALLKNGYTVIGHFFIQLGFRYVIDQALRRLLLAMSHVYDRMMSYFEYNRRQAKRIRKNRKQWQQSSHLTQLAEHKSQTALSEQEQAQRKRQAREG